MLFFSPLCLSNGFSFSVSNSVLKYCICHVFMKSMVCLKGQSWGQFYFPFIFLVPLLWQCSDQDCLVKLLLNKKQKSLSCMSQDILINLLVSCHKTSSLLQEIETAFSLVLIKWHWLQAACTATAKLGCFAIVFSLLTMARSVSKSLFLRHFMAWHHALLTFMLYRR